ncbi:hypothetical protein JTE90_000518 [Oedothorax gibbosus]|uniref:Uncharacterized protein n=1 Tax=Oedothorax gibbosus TaxID=931172 RepID=A0AAV6VWH4_9ARAC|nr:hypothetical protein JTE90_000518 [Oedothorax gibbosus]
MSCCTLPTPNPTRHTVRTQCKSDLSRVKVFSRALALHPDQTWTEGPTPILLRRNRKIRLIFSEGDSPLATITAMQTNHKQWNGSWERADSF